MAIRIAINGFGRIGRSVLRAIHDRGERDFQTVAINDLASPKTLGHLLKYDSVHRTFGSHVHATDDGIMVGDEAIRVLSQPDARALPWKALAVDVVLECTGVLTSRETAGAHLGAGASKVVISAPAKGHDLTVVMGVNDEQYDASKHDIVSNASCTTNCLAPVAKVLSEEFGIQNAFMTTIHSYTNDQALLDMPHRKGDLRRGRSAATNMVPVSSGANRAISEVLPHLEGKFDGQAIRVPTMDVSLVDLAVQTEKPVKVESIHKAMADAAETRLKGILYYTEEELVSSDFIGHPASSIFDATLTRVLGTNYAKVFAWYDNEWGFANRMLDLVRLVVRK